MKPESINANKAPLTPIENPKTNIIVNKDNSIA